MKDIIKEYKKQNFLKNSGIVVTSLALAFGVHTLIFDGQISRYIKANVLEAGTETQNSDLYFSHESGLLTLRNGKSMNEVTSLSFSLVYDASKIQISDFHSPLAGVSITPLVNEPGLATYIINFANAQDISL